MKVGRESACLISSRIFRDLRGNRLGGYREASIRNASSDDYLRACICRHGMATHQRCKFSGLAQHPDMDGGDWKYKCIGQHGGWRAYIGLSKPSCAPHRLGGSPNLIQEPAHAFQLRSGIGNPALEERLSACGRLDRPRFDLLKYLVYLAPHLPPVPQLRTASSQDLLSLPLADAWRAAEN